MSVALHIGLDLGSDTLKIAYAYEHTGDTNYGKLMKDSLPTQVAIPAVAYYDEDSDKWIYGNEVDMMDGGTFVNVVKIKSLLSLLLPKPDAHAVKNNRKHYFEKNDFPKFYFPSRRGMLDDFEKMVEQDMTFYAKNSTPQGVCEGFFKYVYRLVEECVERLSAFKNIEFDPAYKVALVHSARINKIYIDELTRLVQVSFGAKPNKILGSTKALSMYAYWRKVLKEGESLLVFDMGEKDISVAQATLMKGKGLVVDGVDGHNGPCELGGNDIDDSIAEFIESTIRGRETVGTPSHGAEGHIYEHGLHSKQYLFTKDIKKVKMILSMPFDDDDDLFSDGVPISLSRDLHIQRRFTLEEFEACVGVNNNSGVARKIADYIVSELERVVNNEVHKIFLSGGVVETYGIIDYINRIVSKECSRKIEVLTFDDFNDDDDGFNILSYEDSVYAPAVGGAIVSLQNYDVTTVTALSYGTWVGISGYRYLDIFINRGTPLKNNSNLFTTQLLLGNELRGLLSVDDEIYSVAITKDEIGKKKHFDKLKTNYFTDNNGRVYLLIGDRESGLRKNAEKFVQLKVVSGKESNSGIKFQHKGSDNGSSAEFKGGGILFKHGGEYVKLFGRIGVREGAKIDKYGHAVPYLANISELDSGSVRVQYPDGRFKTVPKAEIEPVFFGMDDFDSSAE